MVIVLNNPTESKNKRGKNEQNHSKNETTRTVEIQGKTGT